MNRLTTNISTLEIRVFLKSSPVRSGAIHCALRKSCFIDKYTFFSSVSDINVEDEITRRRLYVDTLLGAHDPILTEYLRLYYQYPEEDVESILQRFKESMAESMATGDIRIDYPDTYHPDAFGVIQEDTSDALQEEMFLLPAEE